MSRIVSADEARGLLAGAVPAGSVSSMQRLYAAAPDLAATVIALSEERDRLRALLACERGEWAPEGWRWEWSTRRWLRARPWNAQVGGRFGGGYGYRIGLEDDVGGFTSMLNAIEAADRAATPQ